MKHKTASAHHYDDEADTYDSFNEKKSALMNQLLEKELKALKVKTVLDMTCGTGSQVFWLKKKGFKVVGSDINEKMLTYARAKGQADFIKGDMRKVKVGPFDAVITIFNAIGHLTQKDFEKALLNVKGNLHPGGYYIFDIFNLDYLLKDDHITQLTIDWLNPEGERVIQYSTVSQEGILASYTTSFSKGRSRPCTSLQTLQIYSAAQLKKILSQKGFKIVKQMSIEGSKFSKASSERILIIAKSLL